MCIVDTRNECTPLILMQRYYIHSQVCLLNGFFPSCSLVRDVSVTKETGEGGSALYRLFPHAGLATCTAWQ